MLRCAPAVFAAGRKYKITVCVKSESVVHVKIGDTVFSDHSNGILRSQSLIHTVEVPQELLDKEKRYTVIVRPVKERRAYFTKTKDERFYTYDFSPVETDEPVCYHIADSHNDSVNCVKAAKAYGKPDFLILNGDVPEDSSEEKNFYTIYDICAEITGGNIPVVFARGNHDLRGVSAESFGLYAPTLNGKTYYTFRLGKIWGIALDCGEDKPDDHPEYGHSVACSQFRREETEYLKAVAESPETEYAEEEGLIKLVVVHMPFTHRFESPFDIEEETYRQWAYLLREYVKPDLMISGHTHGIGIYEPGGDYDDYGQPCKLIIGAEVEKHKYFKGAGIKFKKDGADVTFTDSEGNSEKTYIEY